MTVSTVPANEEAPDIVVMDEPEEEHANAAPESVTPVKAYWVSDPITVEPAEPAKAAAPAPKHVAAAKAPVVHKAPAEPEPEAPAAAEAPEADPEAMAILDAASEPTAAGPAADAEPAASAAPFKPKTSSSTGTDLMLVFGILGLLVAGLFAEPLFRKAIGATS